MLNRASGAVLAGGASRRFGSDKAMFVLDELSMLKHSVDSLRGAGCSPVYVVGGDEQSRDIDHTQYLGDLWPGDGPLGAIVTALEASSAQWLVVLSCDVPAIGPDEIESLLEARTSEVDVVLARSNRGVEPLVAVYSHELKASLREFFEAGTRSVLSALRQVSSVEVELSSESLLNVNRPEDLRTW